MSHITSRSTQDQHGLSHGRADPAGPRVAKIGNPDLMLRSWNRIRGVRPTWQNVPELVVPVWCEGWKLGPSQCQTAGLLALS